MRIKSRESDLTVDNLQVCSFSYYKINYEDYLESYSDYPTFEVLVDNTISKYKVYHHDNEEYVVYNTEVLKPLFSGNILECKAYIDLKEKGQID